MARPTRPPARKPAPESPLPRAVWVLLAVLAAAAIAAVVSYRIYDTDLWQHLLVGKVIWQTHAVPHTMLWVWPAYGQPDVPPSWLFRTLLWPFWAAGGPAGLFAWRWLTTLLAFALLWAAARAAGARGPWVLFALVWCALFYRYRAQARPETLVAVLIAAQLWVLERRRARGAGEPKRDPAWWLVPIALVWANAHISYYMGLMLTTFYLADAAFGRADRQQQQPLRLLGILLACAAVSFVNPFGWRLLAQPFEYFFVWRHEAIYHSIPELQPIWWSVYATSLLPLWLVLLPVLALARVRRRGVDFAQWLCLLVFIPQALQTQRFLGYLAIVVAPFFARDLDELLGGWAAHLRVPNAVRALAIAALVVLLPLPSLRDPALAPGFGIQWGAFPVAACDWIQAHGVRGRSLNNFSSGGYLLWRFWPERDRLPFMDIHQDGSTADRFAMATLGFPTDETWRGLDRKYRFDWVLAPVTTDTTDRELDHLDADRRFALVFCDDAAALYLRRDGADSALAAREAFRIVPGSSRGLHALGELAYGDSLAARAIRGELERRLAASRWNGLAHSLLANLDLMEGNWEGALGHLHAARAVMPGIGRLAERERAARDGLARRR